MAASGCGFGDRGLLRGAVGALGIEHCEAGEVVKLLLALSEIKQSQFLRRTIKSHERSLLLHPVSYTHLTLPTSDLV